MIKGKGIQSIKIGEQALWKPSYRDSTSDRTINLIHKIADFVPYSLVYTTSLVIDLLDLCKLRNIAYIMSH
jgi:hypothetical protein